MFVYGLFIACSGSAKDTGLSGEDGPIIDLNDWRIADASADPFPEHVPDEIECPVTAFRVELDQLEIDTDYCNYANVEFEILRTVDEGTLLELMLFHTGLWAPEPGQAHVAFLLEGEPWFEIEPEIPATADFFVFESTAPKKLNAGETAILHLHNHGANDWRFRYFQKMEE